MRTPDILVIDINGLGYAAMYQPALAKLHHHGFPTGGILGALGSVFLRMTEVPTAVPIVVWDGHCRWRKELYPEYKSNRVHPDKIAIRESYRDQTPYIQLILNRLGIPQVRCDNAEADDVAGVICREIDPSWQVELNSKDVDWWQGIQEHVSWYSPAAKKHVTKEMLADPANGLKEGNFLSTDEFCEAKALAGDDSDAIKGLFKVGYLTAKSVIREHGGSVREFWRRVDSGLIPKGVIATRIAETSSREIFERNLTLMDWRLAPPLDTGALTITAGAPDWGDVEGLMSDLGLARTLSKARAVLGRGRQWGPALDAIYAALHHATCQPQLNPTSR